MRLRVERLEEPPRTPFISHVRFGFDTVFPEDCSNDDVYAQTAEPLVQIALSGGMSTMFMFGQTGMLGKQLAQCMLYDS